MKSKTYFLSLLLFLCNVSIAQYWKITGNNGINSSNFLGTPDKNAVVFKTNNIERGRVLANGFWHFGSSSNYAQFGDSGNLTFKGGSYYAVGANKYVFRFTGNLNYGLYFNQVSSRYEFRNGSGNPVFAVDYNNGNASFKGTLAVASDILINTLTIGHGHGNNSSNTAIGTSAVASANWFDPVNRRWIFCT